VIRQHGDFSVYSPGLPNRGRRPVSGLKEGDGEFRTCHRRIALASKEVSGRPGDSFGAHRVLVGEGCKVSGIQSTRDREPDLADKVARIDSDDPAAHKPQ